MEPESATQPDYRHMNDPELIEERARVREQLEYQLAARADHADLAALAELLDAEITTRGSALVASGGLVPAAWR